MPESAGRILVVEDDGPVRLVVMELLREVGYEVAGAADGREALDCLAWAPDLILLDLTMPRMDGPTFRARQLEDEQASEVPVVLLTARRGVERELSAMRAAGLVTKPFDECSLLDIVRSVLHNTRGFDG